MNTSGNFLLRFWYIFVFLGCVALVGLTWANYRFASENPGGNDFLVHWVGTRALLVEGRSPYSEAVALEIQTRAYGRPAQTGEHELRVAYPLYSVILFLPYALVSEYTLARALWMTTLEVALIGLAFVCLRLTHWKLSKWSLPAYLLFTLLWYHSVRPLINGNAVILVAFSISAGLLALQAGRDELAGILLALTTIKPHIVIVLLVFIIIWTLTQRRWRPLFWMLATVILLSVSVAFFVPDWPLQNLREVLRYSSYNPPGTPGAVISLWLPASGKQIGWVISILLGLLLLTEWFLARRKEFHWFLWTVCLTLVASQWVGIQADPGNFIVLFLPIVLILSVWEERWGKRGRLFIWFMMLALLAIPWVLFLRTLTTYEGQPLQHPGLLFPLPFFLLIMLYWVRWWAIHPRRLLIDALREYEAAG